jgi:hypothetical protein
MILVAYYSVLIISHLGIFLIHVAAAGCGAFFDLLRCHVVGAVRTSKRGRYCSDTVVGFVKSGAFGVLSL